MNEIDPNDWMDKSAPWKAPELPSEAEVMEIVNEMIHDEGVASIVGEGVELSRSEVDDVIDRLAAPVIPIPIDIPEAPGWFGTISPTKDAQPNFSLRAKPMTPFEIARPGWDKVQPHTVVMGKVNPRPGRDQASFDPARWVVAKPDEACDYYDTPFEYGAFLDAKAQLCLNEAQNEATIRPNACQGS